MDVTTDKLLTLLDILFNKDKLFAYNRIHLLVGKIKFMVKSSFAQNCPNFSARVPDCLKMYSYSVHYFSEILAMRLPIDQDPPLGLSK